MDKIKLDGFEAEGHSSYVYKNGGNAKFIEKTSCYSVMTYNKLEYFSAVLMKNEDYDEEYLTWLINESAVKSAFAVKTLEEADEYGFVFNFDAPGNICSAAGQLLRMPIEFNFGHKFNYLRDKYSMTNAELISFNSLMRFDINGYAYIGQDNSNHTPLHNGNRVDVFLKDRVMFFSEPYNRRGGYSANSCWRGSMKQIKLDELPHNIGFNNINITPRSEESLVQLFREIYHNDTEDGVYVE